MKEKIAIIGGGTIGLYIGWKLKEKGYDFHLFEKKEEIGTEVCSGIFSEKIFNFIPQSRKLERKEIKSIFIHFPKKKIELKGKFFIFSHKEIDNLLYSQIKDNVFLKKEIKEIPNQYDKIIGTDGANSTIRRSLGLKNPKFRVGIRGFKEENNSSLIVETWPQKEGFIWKIPNGKKTEYGIMENPNNARIKLDNFLKKNRIKLKETDARIIPMGFSVSKKNGIALCGDSTGINKPWSGGGVIWGLESADILLKHFPDLRRYNKEIKKFKKRVYLYNIFTKIVYFTGKNAPFLIPKKVKIDPDFLF